MKEPTIVRLPCGCALKGNLYFLCKQHALGKLLKEFLNEEKETKVLVRYPHSC